jgi:hypothetical protein
MHPSLIFLLILIAFFDARTIRWLHPIDVVLADCRGGRLLDCR